MDAAIRIIHAGIGEGKVQGRVLPIIRGTLTPEFFPEGCGLEIPDYQREAMLRGEKHQQLKAFLAPDGPGVPNDALLFSRNAGYTPLGSGIVLLEAPLWLADGHQRLEAARARLSSGQDCQPLGVKIFLGSTLPEEVATFEQLNLLQTRVSSDVFLVNRDDTPIVAALRALSEEGPQKNGRLTFTFPVIRWGQEKVAGEDLKARMYFEVVTILHGMTAGKDFSDMIDDLERIARRHGVAQVINNTRTFFMLLQTLAEKQQVAAFIYRLGFMRALAKLLADFELFWDAKNSMKLMVGAPEIRRLRVMKHVAVRSHLGSLSPHVHVHLELLRHMQQDFTMIPKVWDYKPNPKDQ